MAFVMVKKSLIGIMNELFMIIFRLLEKATQSVWYVQKIYKSLVIIFLFHILFLGGLSTEEIIGIVFGCIAGVGLLALIVWAILCCLGVCAVPKCCQDSHTRLVVFR